VAREENAASSIPGVVSLYPNTHVTSMKSWPWPQVLALMGKAGERVMIDLILDTGVFLAIESSHGAYHQLSGEESFYILDIPLTCVIGCPLSELQCLADHNPKNDQAVKSTPVNPKEPRHPSNINFVRNRMMYARAALNAQGSVRFGLRHIRMFSPYLLCSLTYF
jgi:telomerase reverse transcriptase